MITVFLIDDHQVVRNGVRAVIDGHDNMQVVGDAGTLAEATSFLEVHDSDVVLLDLRLPDCSGIEAVCCLRALRPRSRIVVFTAFGTPANVDAALDAGAAGFLVKDADGGAIRRGIRAAVHGEIPVSAGLIDRPSGRSTESPFELDPYQFLSTREQQVLRLLATGGQNKEIAAELNLAEKSVRNVVSRIFRKLRVGNRTEAAMRYRSQL